MRAPGRRGRDPVRHAADRTAPGRRRDHRDRGDRRRRGRGYPGQVRDRRGRGAQRRPAVLRDRGRAARHPEHWLSITFRAPLRDHLSDPPFMLYELEGPARRWLLRGARRARDRWVMCLQWHPELGHSRTDLRQRAVRRARPGRRRRRPPAGTGPQRPAIPAGSRRGTSVPGRAVPLAGNAARAFPSATAPGLSAALQDGAPPPRSSPRRIAGARAARRVRRADQAAGTGSTQRRADRLLTPAGTAPARPPSAALGVARLEPDGAGQLEQLLPRHRRLPRRTLAVRPRVHEDQAEPVRAVPADARVLAGTRGDLVRASLGNGVQAGCRVDVLAATARLVRDGDGAGREISLPTGALPSSARPAAVNAPDAIALAAAARTDVDMIWMCSVRVLLCPKPGLALAAATPANAKMLMADTTVAAAPLIEHDGDLSAEAGP